MDCNSSQGLIRQVSDDYGLIIIKVQCNMLFSNHVTGKPRIITSNLALLCYDSPSKEFWHLLVGYKAPKI
jgi:hypothetical protein